MNLNKAQIIGRLGDNPEVRYMPNGDAVANLSVATSEKWKDQQGQQQELTEWHRVTLYKRRAEVAGEYLQKGSLVYIEGKLRTRKWTDNSGVDRYTTEIIGNQLIMLSGKSDNQNTGTGNQGYQQRQGNQQSGNGNRPTSQSPQNGQQGGMAEPDFDFDDDIPFAPLFKQYRGMHYAI